MFKSHVEKEHRQLKIYYSSISCGHWMLNGGIGTCITMFIWIVFIIPHQSESQWLKNGKKCNEEDLVECKISLFYLIELFY